MLKVKINSDREQVYEQGQVITASQFIEDYKDTIPMNEDGQDHTAWLDSLTQEMAVHYIAGAWGVSINTFYED